MKLSRQSKQGNSKKNKNSLLSSAAMIQFSCNNPLIILFTKGDLGQVFKNRLSKICGRKPLKTFTWLILEYLDSFECSADFRILPFENLYLSVSFYNSNMRAAELKYD